MSRLNIFESPQQANANRDQLQSLRISGIAVVLYVMHEIDPEQMMNAFGSGRLRMLRGATTYESKVRAGSPLHYSQPREIADECFSNIVNHRLRLKQSVRQNAIWIKHSPVVVCAISLKLQVGHLQTHSGSDLEFSPNFTMQDPWGVREVVDFIAQVTSPPFLDSLSSASAEQLRVAGVEPIESTPFDSVLGVDIWSLSGSAGRATESPFEGAREAALYAWPIAAVLNYTSDHIVNHFFEQMSYEEVYSRVREGFGFMQDHAIFLTAACTLEITHFDDWVPQRSWDRLRDYGFDSSTLFILGVSLARNASYRVVAQTSGDSMLRLTRNDLHLAEEVEDTEHDSALALLRVLDSLSTLHLDFREERSQTVDREFQALFGDANFERASRQRLDEVRRLALDRRDKKEQSANQRGVMRLTLAAAVLAVASIPAAVEQLWSWAESDDLLKLGASGVVMALALWLTTRAVANLR